MRATFLSLAATAGLIIGGAAIVHAQPPRGSSVPVDRVSGSGAGGAASGHSMQQTRSEPGTRGASGFAPGRVGTTGAGDRDDRIRDDRDEPMLDNREGRLHDRDDRPTTGDPDDRR